MVSPCHKNIFNKFAQGYGDTLQGFPLPQKRGYGDTLRGKYKIQKYLCLVFSGIWGQTAGLLLPQEISHFPPHFNTAPLSSPHFLNNFNFHFPCETFTFPVKVKVLQQQNLTPFSSFQHSSTQPVFPLHIFLIISTFTFPVKLSCETFIFHVKVKVSQQFYPPTRPQYSLRCNIDQRWHHYYQPDF